MGSLIGDICYSGHALLAEVTVLYVSLRCALDIFNIHPLALVLQASELCEWLNHQLNHFEY